MTAATSFDRGRLGYAIAEAQRGRDRWAAKVLRAQFTNRESWCPHFWVVDGHRGDARADPGRLTRSPYGWRGSRLLAALGWPILMPCLPKRWVGCSSSPLGSCAAPPATGPPRALGGSWGD